MAARRLLLLLLCACPPSLAASAFSPPPGPARTNPISRGARDRLPPGTTTTTSPPPCRYPSSSALPLAFRLRGGEIELADLLYDSTSTAFEAWEWTANIGAPAALVAGAVLVTLSETRECTAPRRADPAWVRLTKQTMRFLLLTSFALEVVSIFVSTMTGSVLLGHGEQAVKKAVVGYGSPLALLYHHHEFEYLTIQICFLQGLFNWLAAVAAELFLPREGENLSARRMNRCLAGWLVSLMLWILAFYNNHLSFYSDYAAMLRRYVSLFLGRYVTIRPVRPMSLLYGPSFVASAVLTWRAFRSPPDEDDD